MRVRMTRAFLEIAADPQVSALRVKRTCACGQFCPEWVHLENDRSKEKLRMGTNSLKSGLHHLTGDSRETSRCLRKAKGPGALRQSTHAFAGRC